jgi:hypothetical protein
VIDLREVAATEAAILIGVGALLVIFLGGAGWLVWLLVHHLHWS